MRSAAWAALASICLACAPAHEAPRLLLDLESPDVEVRTDAAEKLAAILKSGEYEVFARSARQEEGMMKVQSILYLARFEQPGARAALRDLLRLEERSLVPFSPISMKPTTTRTDSRILVANLIARHGGDPEAVGALLGDDAEGQPPDVLAGTCFALGALRDGAAVPFLSRAAAHDDVEVARAAVEALGRVPTPEALGALGAAAGHRAPEVRIVLLSSVELRDEPEALDLLRRIGAEDADPEIRAQAIRQIGRFPREEVVPYLVERLRAPQPVVRAAALETLARVTGESLGPEPDRWARWWSQRAGTGS